MDPRQDTTDSGGPRQLLGGAALEILSVDELATLEAFLLDNPEDRAELSWLRFAVSALPLAMEERAPSAALRDRIEAAVLAEMGGSGQGNLGQPVAGYTTEPVEFPGVNAANAPLPVVEPAPVYAPAPVTGPTLAPPAVGAPTLIRPERSRWTARFWPAAAAILLLVSGGLLAWNMQLRSQLDAPPRYATVALQPNPVAPNAAGNLTLMDNGAVVLLSVQDLPPLEAGHVYEVWLIGANGNPVAAGTFDDSNARHAVAVAPGEYQTLAITAEPGPMGSPNPTGDILAQADMTQANAPS